MSEQHKTNFQAFGAALFGFIAVIAVGGGALMLHSSHKNAAPKPVPAAEPIDLASPAPREREAVALPTENRTESPAPLVGSDDDDTDAADAPADASPSYAGAETAEAAAESFPESASDVKSGGRRLRPTEHLDLSASGRASAEAVAAKGASVARKNAKFPAARKPSAKLAAAVASVHYGVTSREELMGRAAGPVYNIKSGSSVPRANPSERGKLASEMNERLAGLQWKLKDDTGLSAEQRVEIEQELADIKKGVADVGGSR